jgi:hypothetical protein
LGGHAADCKLFAEIYCETGRIVDAFTSKITGKHGDVENWKVVPWGKNLRACTLMDSADDARIVSVIDIGSNTVKQNIFDRHDRSLTPSLDKDGMPQLSKGMRPNDPEPRLNGKGVEFLLDELLPRFQTNLAAHKTDTVIVVCTEAVRAAHRFDRAAVNVVLRKCAKRLCIPHRAINILGEDEEAKLAARAICIENRWADFSVTQGGGSTEIALIPRGTRNAAFRKTLRFGTQSLKAAEDAYSIISNGFASTAWFNTQESTSHDKNHRGGTRREIICLQGGPFRPVSRLLAQEIHDIPFYINPPYGGMVFVWDQRLEKALTRLASITSEGLLYEFIRWGNPQKRKATDEHLARWVQTKEYERWRETPVQEKGSLADKEVSIYRRWQKRVARRGEGIPSAAQTILAAAERIKPHEIVIGRRSIREAALLEHV